MEQENQHKRLDEQKTGHNITRISLRNSKMHPNKCEPSISYPLFNNIAITSYRS
jgi:hypothetical protein